MSLDIKDLRRFPNYSGVFGMVSKKKDKVVLTRDPIGEMPLYFSAGSTVVVANTIADMKKESSFESIRAVPPGYEVHMTQKKISYVSYYKFHPKKVSLDLPSVSTNLRTLLNRAVKTPKGKRVAVLLSGGCDSFCVSYLLKRHKVDFTAYTLTIDNKSKDLKNAERAASFLNIPLKRVNVSKANVIKSLPAAVKLSELYKDYDVYMALGSYFLAKAAEKDGVEAVYTGEGANELFGDYKPWGSFQMRADQILTKRVRKLMVFGRNPRDKHYNRQLGSGLGRSLSRLNKIFFHHGLNVYNPFLNIQVVEYLLSLPKKFLYRHPKQELCRLAFPDVPPELFPEKIRLQDGVGITAILGQAKEKKLRKIFFSEHQ